MNEEKDNIIVDKSFAFAIRVINLYKHLKSSKSEFVISKQLLRSGTSIGANVEEAVGGYSKKDFKAKLGISYKEARETRYWLKLLFATDFILKDEFESMLNDINEIIRILISIIKNTKE